MQRQAVFSSVRMAMRLAARSNGCAAAGEASSTVGGSLLSSACSTSGRCGTSLWERSTLVSQHRWVSSLSSVIATEQGKTRLQGYLPNGFIINSTQVEGPILCLPELWLMWDVAGGLGGVTMESLAVLDLMAPPPEVLVVGCGARLRQLPAALMQQLSARGIAVEVLDTRNALSYFNFLNEEGRVVVGALLPVNEDTSAPP